MKSKTTILILLVVLAVFSQKKATAQDQAIVNTTVIDATGRDARANMTILITDGIITGIKPANKVKPASKTRIIDGKGKYVIPGLWDMHVHNASDSLFCTLMVANGVTSVREMLGPKTSYSYQLEWRNQISRKQITGPHIYIPMAALGPLQNWGGVTVSTEQEAIDFVKECKRLDVDFIKVFDLYDANVITTLLREAQKEGIRVGGHCPLSLNAADAAEAGLGTIEHTYEMLVSTSSQEDSIRAWLEREASVVHESKGKLMRLLYFVSSPDVLKTYDPDKAARLFERLKASGNYQCPTLYLFDGQLKGMYRDTSDVEGIQYVKDDCLKGWKTFYSRPTNPTKTSDYEQVRKINDNKYELVRAMNKVGIPFLTGTDVGSGCTHLYLVPGFSLHGELCCLVKAGLSTMQALQAATRNAAAALGVLDKTGTLEAGKCADLVVLNENPLEDIRNTRKIHAVINNGIYLSRSDLDNLLDKAYHKVHP